MTTEVPTPLVVEQEQPKPGPVRPAYTVGGIRVPGNVKGLTRLTFFDVDGVEQLYRESLDDIAETILGSLDDGDDDPVNSMMTGRIAATVLYTARQWTADQWNCAMQAAVAFAEYGSVAKGEVA